MAMRLDKFLTELGIGTRSEVKKIIKAKKIQVNGETVLKPEQKIDENLDKVFYQGELLAYQKFEYYLLHKPAGCVTATEDSGHQTVMDYLKNVPRKDLFPVGRLDLDTEGLLLITNDGKLAHELLSPVKHVPKTYFAKIGGEITTDDVVRFQEGIDIGEEKPTKPALLEILSSATESEVYVTITEGKFHQVKRMFHAVGKEVLYLKRISMGPLTLPDDLDKGCYRPLTEDEILALRNSTGMQETK
ncbi:MAG: pseudouridine synthase [Roseburia sp.]